MIDPLKLKKIKKLLDRRFDVITLWKDPKTEMYYHSKSDIFNSKEAALKKIFQLKKRTQNPNLFFVAPTTSKIYDANEFCTSLYKVTAYTPYPGKDLSKEIKERRMDENHFSHFEITSMLYNLIYGMSHLQKLGFAHGKFRPEFVALSTTGYAVMEDPFHDPKHVVDVRNEKELFLSPEAYRSALFRQENELDLARSDVYSCGLVLMKAALLEQNHFIYGHKDVDSSQVQARLKRVKTKYPENLLFFSTLKRMLDHDWRKRPNFREIKKILPNFDVIQDYFNTHNDVPAFPKKNVDGPKNQKLLSEEDTPQFQNPLDSCLGRNQGRGGGEEVYYSPERNIRQPEMNYRYSNRNEKPHHSPSSRRIQHVSPSRKVSPKTSQEIPRGSHHSVISPSKPHHQNSPRKGILLNGPRNSSRRSRYSPSPGLQEQQKRVPGHKILYSSLLPQNHREPVHERKEPYSPIRKILSPKKQKRAPPGHVSPERNVKFYFLNFLGI